MKVAQNSNNINRVLPIRQNLLSSSNTLNLTTTHRWLKDATTYKPWAKSRHEASLTYITIMKELTNR